MVGKPTPSHVRECSLPRAVMGRVCGERGDFAKAAPCGQGWGPGEGGDPAVRAVACKGAISACERNVALTPPAMEAMPSGWG